jgi:hypothetical protein
MGGRKAKLSADDVRKAAAMLRDPMMTKAEVAKHFKVSRVTLNAALLRVDCPADLMRMPTPREDKKR